MRDIIHGRDYYPTCHAAAKGEYMYKTEAHVHTAEISPCGEIPARELAELYAAAGYSTLFVTDHIYKSIFDKFGDISWEEKVDRFLIGYREAKARGEELGLTVLLGAEFGFKNSEGGKNDYLVYGIDRDFLLGAERALTEGLDFFVPYAAENGIPIIQAHPYRTGCVPVPERVSAIEIYNGHPRHENHNEMAEALALEWGLPGTYGSDAHRAHEIATTAILTEKKIESGAEYNKLLMERALSFERK